jgi:hypothetical protein
LAAGLARISTASDSERVAMGQASRLLASQLTPQRWASNVLARIPELRGDAGLLPAPWTSADSSAVGRVG